MVLLDTVPGTLFLKTLDSNRYLAIPVELVDFVPGTDGSPKSLIQTAILRFLRKLWKLYLVPMVEYHWKGETLNVEEFNTPEDDSEQEEDET